MPAAASLDTAVDTMTRSAQMIGLETATPPTGVRHTTCSPVFTFQLTGNGDPSATPDAAGPRNIGQFCADSVVPVRMRAMIRILTTEDAEDAENAENAEDAENAE